MASSEKNIYDLDFKQILRDVLIVEYGELWDEYCYQNNIPSDIKLGFLDFILKSIENEENK